MGCDIHGVIEVHIEGHWQKALSLADMSPRNYGLFALLFGVRGDSPYEYKYRGFPRDIAWYSEFEFCDECEGSGHDEASLEMKERFHKYHPDEKECQHCCDWHSVSWITWQEVERHWDEIIRVISGRYPNPEWEFVFNTMRFWASYLPERVKVIESTPALSTGKEDTSRVRMVVWFDN